jgi:VanZ family protein
VLVSFNSKSLFIYAAIALLIAGGLVMPHLVVKHDTVAHIGAFFVLMIWPAVTLPQLKQVALAAAALISVGGLAEFIQRYSPERTASWEDFSMNVIGVALGAVCGLLIRRRLRKL